MSGKIYWHLLLFCGILCQEIFATLSDDDNRLSSDSLVRKRRVINHLPGGRVSIPIESVPYIVRIKEDRRFVCSGAILSHRTVITLASCFREQRLGYEVYSGASGDVGISLQRHNISSKVEHYGNLPHQHTDGIALITVNPSFEYSRKIKNIPLYVGPLPANKEVTVSGWGYQYPPQPGSELRYRLRRINLPILDHTECRNVYIQKFAITDKYICTFCQHQYCARNDAGAPLVVDNKLAAIHIWKGEFPNQGNPDVYIDLQRPDYRQWIIENAFLF